MTTTVSSTQPADYGIDAPGVIRNLALVAVAAIAIWATAAVGWWSGVVDVSPASSVRIRIALAQSGLPLAVSCALMACWMLWYSRIGKIRGRERLLDQLSWSGSEQVLDVGCGRGLMLIGAAKRLSTGRATGIDVWQTEDLTGNARDATLENASREGVADRVDVRTADMRDLPFPDNTFDIVLSCAAIHNIYSREGRKRAIAEIARVLRPGGQALIDDIRHYREYTAGLSDRGCTVRRASSRVTTAFFAVATFGSLRPATLVVRKAFV